MMPLLKRGLLLMAASPVWAAIMVASGLKTGVHVMEPGSAIPLVSVIGLFFLCVACLASGALLCLVSLFRSRRAEEPIADEAIASALVFVAAYQAVRFVGSTGQPIAAPAAAAVAAPSRAHGAGGSAFGGLLLAIAVLIAAIAAIRRVRRLVE